MSEIKQKPKKKPVNSRSKGNGFENKLSKILSVGLAPLNFIRTQGSGARVGGKNFETIGKMFGDEALKLFVGDVVPINERETRLQFRWSIESKFYKSPDTFPHLAAGTANLYKWFNEAVDDAKKVQRLPMLIFKWNATQIFVAVQHYDAPETDIAPLITITLGESRIEHGERTLKIYSLDSLLADKNFWFTSTE